MINYPYYPNLNLSQPSFNQGLSPSQDERIWVQNATSAEAYLLAPKWICKIVG